MAHVGHTHGSVADMIFSVGPRVHRALRYRNSLRLSGHPRGRPACGAHMHGKAPAAQWDVRPFQRPIISHTHVLWPFGGVAARAAQLPPSKLKKPNSAEQERKHVQTRERK